MIMNLFIIGMWVFSVIVISIGLFFNEKKEDKKKQKAREKLWLI